MIYDIKPVISLRVQLTLGLLLFVINTNCQIKNNFDSITIDYHDWMLSNLNVDHFRNGEPIQQAVTQEEWNNAVANKQPAWCYYDNDSINAAKYGKLYNWYAVNDPRGLAPQGWHIPSDSEWSMLHEYIGKTDYSGIKLKARSAWAEQTSTKKYQKQCPYCINWTVRYRTKKVCHTCKNTGIINIAMPKRNYRFNSPNMNLTGFSALPGGCRDDFGFMYLHTEGTWWSSSENESSKAFTYSLSKHNNIFTRLTSSFEYGYSVRCIKD